jgi:glutaconate CoA-transferase, subunit B
MTASRTDVDEPETAWTADEMMTIAASRTLHDHDSCFVGIGIPSTAAILARTTRAPDLTLIYESGAIGSRPATLPLSIGDGELARTALAVVGIPEIFNYWLQPGRIGTGFLGAAQVDRLGNINTTVIGDDYEHPKVRLPGAGGAPEIAGACREVTIICRQSKRTFIEHVDFVTTVGHGRLPGDRAMLGLSGEGPTRVITDLGVLEPDPITRELVLVAVHPNVTIEQVVAATGWPLQVSTDVTVTEPPTEYELTCLRALTSSTLAVPVS